MRPYHTSIYPHTSSAVMADHAVHIFTELCEKALTEKGRFDVAFSGGSTPIPFYKALGKKALPWDKIHMFCVDERCVPPTDPQSNYGMIEQALLRQISYKQFYRMEGEAKPEDAAIHYEKVLRAHFTHDVIPRFDVIVLGLGTDGHIASLFECTPQIRETQRLCEHHYVKKLVSHRLTLTLSVLNTAQCCLFLVAGQEKRSVVQSALDILAPSTLPVHMLRPESGKVVWLLENVI